MQGLVSSIGVASRCPSRSRGTAADRLPNAAGPAHELVLTLGELRNSIESYWDMPLMVYPLDIPSLVLGTAR